MRRLLTRFARALLRLWGGGLRAIPLIEAYIGYATPEALIARGRVLSAIRQAEPRAGQSRWRNLRQMAALFLTDEVADVPVSADGSTSVTDAEGYFTLTLPRAPGHGWREVPAHVPGGAEVMLPVLLPDPDAAFGIISDIDDTILETGAYSLARNLWTTFTGSTLTRHIYPDAVQFLTALHAGRNPVFYVSSSPWNLHGFLERLFQRAGLVPGPMFLRDLGLRRETLGKGAHGRHKSAAIDDILAANPRLSFVLIGDTGQRDAEVYADIAARHPGRVRRIVLRQSGRGPRPDPPAAVAAARAGIPVEIGPDYAHLLPIAPDG